MATKKDNLGFNSQWVQIFRTGHHEDSEGNSHEIDAAFIEKVVNNFNPELHEPPATIGHPKTSAPAFGWACALRNNSGVLEAQFCDNEPQFEEMVRSGRFKKRSSAFYLNEKSAPGGRVPQLQHVAFLGAKAPAVKGLRDIEFHEGEAVIFEAATFSEEEDMNEEKVKSTVIESIKEFFANLGGSKDEKTKASFSEAELDARIKKATDAVTATFTEKFTALEKENEGLKKRLDDHSGSATRTEIISFCERLGAGQFLPAFKRMGVIEFMETLATVPEKKVSVITFAEEGGKEVKKPVEISMLQFFQNFLKTLPTFVEFGEKFGDLQLKGDASEITDPEAMQGLRQGMGVKEPEGGKQ